MKLKNDILKTGGLLMISKKLLAGILAASLATVPLITTYASMPDIEDVS